MKLYQKFALAGVLATGAVIGSDAAFAQAATEATADVKYILSSLLFLIGGFLVMFMAAGFAMLEAGLVRSKNVSMQCLKNIALYSVAGLMFWVVGYNLMYEGVVADTGWMGTPTPKVIPATDADAGSYAAGSDWFFQMGSAPQLRQSCPAPSPSASNSGRS